MNRPQIPVLHNANEITSTRLAGSLLWQGDVETFLNKLPEEPLFDLVFTSPPYNLGKEYEKRTELDAYLTWQKRIIELIAKRMKPSGSICWQVGNFVQEGRGARGTTILPLDIVFHPLFASCGFHLRNRVIWHFGHGLHCKARFSGRYEVVLWYTKTDDYVFNLESILIPQKYPGKKHFKGPNAGSYSCNPKGKNPEDVWEIPNVKSNHIEKTSHPCQFPVALVERFVLGVTNPKDVVFDPFAGVGSAGVAALMNDRRFWGCELDDRYALVAHERLASAAAGDAKYRSLNQPIYDHTKSSLSRRPTE